MAKPRDTPSVKPSRSGASDDPEQEDDSSSGSQDPKQGATPEKRQLEDPTARPKRKPRARLPRRHSLQAPENLPNHVAIKKVNFRLPVTYHNLLRERSRDEYRTLDWYYIRGIRLFLEDRERGPVEYVEPGPDELFGKARVDAALAMRIQQAADADGQPVAYLISSAILRFARKLAAQPVDRP